MGGSPTLAWCQSSLPPSGSKWWLREEEVRELSFSAKSFTTAVALQVPRGHWGLAPTCGDGRCCFQAAGGVLSGVEGSGGGHAELWKLLSSPSCPRLQAPGGDLRLTGFGGPSPPRLSHGVRAVCTQWRRGLSPDPSVVMGPGDTGGLAGPLLIKSLPPSSSPGPPRAPPRTARSLFWKPGTSSSIPQLPVMVPGLGLECALWTGFQWVRGAGRGAGTVRSSGTATQLHQSTEHERPPWSSEAALLPRAVWPWGLGWVLSPGGSSS